MRRRPAALSRVVPRPAGIAAAGAFFLLAAARAGAAFLPATLTPPAPFPLVVAQSLEREFVAPGVERAIYRLQTSAGPLVISVVGIDPREPSVRFGTVLAHDRVVSAGETVSAMAARTGAVAGINGDYFDIGNTNTPLGVLAQDGALIRSPSSRTALTVVRDRSIRFENYRFHGSASVNGNAPIAISSVNEWPPHDGAAFLTPSYGIPAAVPATVIAELTPLPTPASAPGGRYRVTQIDSGVAPTQPGFALALGPAAQSGLTVLPDVGDLIDVALATDPPLADVAQAIGGGPALLANGVAVDDPTSPGYAARDRRIPVAAAARLPAGDVALVVVDGRRPTISIGVDRAELIALLTGMGATDAMQFDSGGSATLVARVLGETAAGLQNEPSDGVERPVADGLFVYSDLPVGPPARLVVRPSSIEALPGAAVALRAAIVDAAGHALGPARGVWHVTGAGAQIGGDDVLRAGNEPLATTLQLERAGIHGELPLEIVSGVARIAIVPERPNPDPGVSVALRAQAFDPRGQPIETGDRISWSALRGSVSSAGVFTAGATDGFVTASLGDVKSSELVHVGRHHAPLLDLDPGRGTTWHFSSIPAGGPGALAFTVQGTLQLSYDFRTGERAAYADANVSLGEPLVISCAIDGDGNGAGLRLALVDRYGERLALTLVKTIDWMGTQRHDVRVPASLAPPLVLQSIYAIGSLGPAPVRTAATVGIHNCDVTLPGTARHAP